MAASPDHGKLDETLQGVHRAYQWAYANAGARTGATGFVSTDVGKLARQTDDNSLWLLTAVTPTWVQVGGLPGMTDPMTAAGDMIIRNAANATDDLDIGALGQVLVVRGGTPIPTWETQYSTLNFVIDGGGAEIADGVAGDIVVDFACNIVAWTLLADISGAIKIDVWLEHYADYPPTDADTITNAHEPEIAASGVKAQDTNLSDWITNPPAIEAGQTLRFNVDSCTDITRCTIALKVERT